MSELKQELDAALEREAATREILRIINRSRNDYAPVLDAILERAIRLCDAPFGMFYLCRPEAQPAEAQPGNERGYMECVATRGTRSAFTDELLSNPLPLDSSQSVTARAALERVTIHCKDLADDRLYRERQPQRVYSVEIEGIRTAVFVPVATMDESFGTMVLYRREVRPFDDAQVDLVSTFAEQAVIAIENVRLFRELEDRTHEVRSQAEELARWNQELETRVSAQVDELDRLGRLRRFLSPQVADAVVSSGEDDLLGSHRALIAVVSCDLRGFTAFCESAEPEEAIDVLQSYHAAMGMLIHEHGGTIDHRAGDGILVIFNDPLPCDDPAGDALSLSMSMRDRMAELGRGWRRLGHRLGFGVGMSLGYATVGMVGFEGRYDYTANGSTVNLAARLCDEAGDGEILLSARAYAAVEERVVASEPEELDLKGFHAPVEVFRLTRAPGNS
jgi:class 3 adenylate cyclase